MSVFGRRASVMFETGMLGPVQWSKFNLSV